MPEKNVKSFKMGNSIYHGFTRGNEYNNGYKKGAWKNGHAIR